MKKVLFIIQSYPSNRSANVLCDEKIMKAMLDGGKYEIHCLCYRFHGQSIYEELNGFKIHRLKRDAWWDLYTYARDKEEKPFFKTIVKLNRFYMRLRQLCFIPIYPNYEPLLARQMARSAIALHKKENFDVVIAEHSGRDTLYAGMKLKEFDSNVKMISILWDPISGKELAKYLPHSYAHRRMLSDEEMLLCNSDIIICLQSNKKYQQYNSVNKSFYNRIKFLDIPGIVPPAIECLPQQFTKNDKINILYSGILTIPDRNPSVLIEVIKRSRFAKNINLMFFSAGNGIEKAKECLKSFEGSHIVHGYIPKALLNSVARNSDILLNIGGPNPRMVPSKIFEYISLCKPIISTYFIDNEASKEYLDKYPVSLCIDLRKTVEENVSLLDNFIERSRGIQVNFSDVENMYPLNRPARFVDIINELLD